MVNVAALAAGAARESEGEGHMGDLRGRRWREISFVGGEISW